MSLFYYVVGGIENHGSAGVVWAASFLEKSPRYNNSSTTKIIVFATSGYITDRDAIVGLHVDSWRYAATRLHGLGEFPSYIWSH